MGHHHRLPARVPGPGVSAYFRARVVRGGCEHRPCRIKLCILGLIHHGIRETSCRQHWLAPLALDAPCILCLTPSLQSGSCMGSLHSLSSLRHGSPAPAALLFSDPDEAALGRKELAPSILVPTQSGSNLHRGDMIKPPPNIGVLLGESLSGLALGSKRGRKESPFYHKTLARRLGVYRFAHERAVSGLTQEAAPAVLSGLLPHNREGKVQQLRVSLASEFKARNYTTAAFCSVGCEWDGKYTIFSHHLTSGFDRTVGPKSTGEKVVNEFGMDD